MELRYVTVSSNGESHTQECNGFILRDDRNSYTMDIPLTHLNSAIKYVRRYLDDLQTIFPFQYTITQTNIAISINYATFSERFGGTTSLITKRAILLAWQFIRMCFVDYAPDVINRYILLSGHILYKRLLIATSSCIHGMNSPWSAREVNLLSLDFSDLTDNEFREKIRQVSRTSTNGIFIKTNNSPFSITIRTSDIYEYYNELVLKSNVITSPSPNPNIALFKLYSNLAHSNFKAKIIPINNNTGICRFTVDESRSLPNFNVYIQDSYLSYQNPKHFELTPDYYIFDNKNCKLFTTRGTLIKQWTF